jgi:hypothetical protein
MLHCAKLRDGSSSGNFIPAGSGTTKLTLDRCDVSLSLHCRRFASLRPSLYE